MLLLLLLQAQSPLAATSDTLKLPHQALHYDIQVSVGDTAGHIAAQVQTTWLLRSRDTLIIPFDDNMRTVRVLMDGQESTRLSRTLYARGMDVVAIPHEKGPGDTLRTAIRYHGTPANGLFVKTDSLGRRVAFADNWPDRAMHWFPVANHPSEKATVDFHVEVPAGLRVIANGVLQKVDTLSWGRTVWHFHESRPIPMYGMVLGAAPFAITHLPDAACEVRCVPLAVYTFVEDSAWAVTVPFRRAGDMVDYFSRLVGPFPYERLSHVEAEYMSGGMENPTAIFYGANLYPSHRLSERVVAHETAHQWFGDAVTEADWHHLWLSEGFATYFAALWTGHADGDSAFRAEMSREAETVFGSRVTDRPILDMETQDLMGLLNSNNYPKGSWVLHQLRGVIGDSAFFGGIRRYYAVYRDSVALSADFARVMSEAAGRDLDWYFLQSLTQPGYPQLDVAWRRKGRKLTITLRQTQEEAWGLYRIPGLVLDLDGRRVPVDLSGRETTVTVDGFRKDPSLVSVDPDGWWLVKATVRGPK